MRTSSRKDSSARFTVAAELQQILLSEDDTQNTNTALSEGVELICQELISADPSDPWLYHGFSVLQQLSQTDTGVEIFEELQERTDIVKQLLDVYAKYVYFLPFEMWIAC